MKKSNKMKQISFRIQEELHKKVKIKAAQKGVSLTSILQKILKDFVTEG